MSARGFTLVELLVALTITLVIAGVLGAAAPAARAAFDRVPAELDRQQRGRMAIDTITRALRASDHVMVAVPDDAGRFAELTTVATAESAAQGVLAFDQASPVAAMMLAAWRCPNVKDVCGFTSGSAAMISDGGDGFDVFMVGATNAAQRWLAPSRALSRAYPAGSIMFEVEQSTFRLDAQEDGTDSLTRVTAAGAVQPMVDGLRSLAFTIDGRRVDVEVVVQAPGLDDRAFRTSIALRNAGNAGNAGNASW